MVGFSDISDITLINHEATFLLPVIIGVSHSEVQCICDHHKNSRGFLDRGIRLKKTQEYSFRGIHEKGNLRLWYQIHFVTVLCPSFVHLPGIGLKSKAQPLVIHSLQNILCAVEAVHRLAASSQGRVLKLSHVLTIDPFRCLGYPAGCLGFRDEAGVHTGSKILSMKSY